MRKSRKSDPRQLDLLAWTPPSATVLQHPGLFRAVWKPKISSIADIMAEKPVYAENLSQWGPIRLGEQLAGMGATEREIAREVGLYQQAMLAEMTRRRHGNKRQGPGAA